MDHYCRRCKRTPEQVAFTTDPSSASGLDYRCKECRAELARLRYASDPQKYRGKTRAWRSVPENAAKVDAYMQQWLSDNAERVRKGQKERSLRWYIKNAEKARANASQWRKDNPARVAANNASREARKILATPQWANPDRIREIYVEARRLTLETGIEHHVDHEVPLRGRTVSGLHWEGNLKIIPAAQNVSKKHLHWPGM